MVFPTMLLVTAALSFTSQADSPKAPDYGLTMPEKGVVVATPPEGHHINVKAPMYLEQDGFRVRIQPVEAKPDRVRFPELTMKKGKLSISLFLCDDKNTFCEFHRMSATFDGKTLADIHAVLSPHASAEASETSARTDTHGFILNDAKQALATAKKLKKPLMIDFFGIWCPPCNELDSQVFAAPDFEKATQGFVKLKLDVDAEPSWALKSRYKIGGYPTVVFADSNGEEISRIVGTRQKEVFFKEIQTAWTNRESSLPVLTARANKGDPTAAGRLGAILTERKEFEKAIPYLRKDPTNAASREALAVAEIGLYEERKDEPKLMAALESAIASFPKSPISIDHRMKLADLFSEKKEAMKEKILLTGAIEASKNLIESPKDLENTEVTAADLWSTIAEAQEKLGEEKLARNAWANAANEYRKHKPAADERGFNLELAYALFSSGDDGAAEEIYKKLEEAYPDEFTFYYAHASMKLKLKKNSDAQPLAQLALTHSYGDNKLRSALLLAKVLKEVGKPVDAASVIDTALKSVALPKDESIRTHRYVKSLQEFKAKLAT